MSIIKKVAFTVAGGAIIVGSGLGVASMASAEAPGPTPTASPAWQRGGGYGRMGGTTTPANPNAGLRNGAGYGAVENAEYLAGKLGVSQDAVSTAMQKFHTINPTQARGRDLTDVQQATRRAELAAFLAKELNVSEATVLAALNGQQQARQADRTATIKANLEEAVKAGRVTQAQADAILAAHEAGDGMGGMRGGFGSGPRR